MVNWVVDELLGERAEHTGFPSIADAAEQLGHTVFRTKYVPCGGGLQDWPPFHPHSCVIAYGTVNFCKAFEKERGRLYTPSLYFNENVKHFSRFAVHIGEDLLNKDYYILPFRDACRRLLKHQTLFIKPESGMKEFVGQVIRSGLSEEQIERELCPHGIIEPHTLCIVASPRRIEAEFRYVIVERQIIAKSEYRWDNKLDVRIDTHPLCDALAEKIAKAEWQADTCYVCDIALVQSFMHGQQAKVIELNAFSSSGLYACDTLAIVKAVSRAAEKEWSGEIENQ